MAITENVFESADLFIPLNSPAPGFVTRRLYSSMHAGFSLNLYYRTADSSLAGKELDLYRLQPLCALYGSTRYSHTH